MGEGWGNEVVKAKYGITEETAKQKYDIIETELKRLEELEKKYNALKEHHKAVVDTTVKQDKILRIIKEKRVNVHLLLLSDSLEKYNFKILPHRKLTQEEYKLLKERLE